MHVPCVTALCANVCMHVFLCAQVAELMRLWTRQVGYPVLILPEATDGVLVQARFLTTGEGGPGQWMVPLTALAGDASQPVELGLLQTPEDYARVTAWLREREGTLVKLNAGQVGFYRVCYNARGWDAIMRGWSVLPRIDRLGILTDGTVARRPGSRATCRYVAINVCVWAGSDRAVQGGAGAGCAGDGSAAGVRRRAQPVDLGRGCSAP
jgi:hypothetical protein